MTTSRPQSAARAPKPACPVHGQAKLLPEGEIIWALGLACVVVALAFFGSDATWLGVPPYSPFAAAGLWPLAHWRFGRIADPEEPAKRLGMPVYAVAPPLTRRVLRHLPPDRRTASDFVMDRPDSDYAAVFRRLGAVAIQRSRGEAPVVAVMAASAGDEGASEAFALARTMALLGKGTIVVDCDLAKRTLTRIAGVAARAGVSETLSGLTAWRDAVEHDHRSHLSILAAADGAEKSDGLFDGVSFSTLLSELCAAHDLVILSCPCVLGPTAVAPSIARHASTCVLVVRWTNSSMRRVRAALRVLTRFNSGTMPGMLLTNAPTTGRFRRYLRPLR